MSNKTSIMRAFNTHFFDFMDDIISIYPENNEISSARVSFDTIKRANPTAIVKVWYLYVYSPYKEVIDQGNISFFFEKDYSGDLATLVNANEIMKIIDKIRKPIQGMDDANKEHTTKYIQNLSKLSVAYDSLE
jgi:hypothetical protein